ncbi:MAG: NF038122 family metalloprotease, partial [Planctomycetota bacterium]|nr:NF038122 family metalloprotease [Planctomycetota bacterium]
MIVRGGTMLTGGVWDDTSIVHVVLDEVVIPDLHTFGGLRLQSSSDQSLVVKFLGEHANIRSTGRPLEIEDRVGGMLHVLGQPGSPVVMTSLADDSVGAGLDPSGRPQNDTDGVGRPERTKPVGTFQFNVNYGPVARSTPGVIEAAEAAIQIWERLLEDPITVSIDFEITDLGNGAPGVFTVNEVSLPYETVRQAMITDAAGRGNETVVARLPDFATLNNNVVLPNDPGNPFTLANTMTFARANALALGIAPSLLPARPSAFDPTETIDGTVNINFNPLGTEADGTPVFYDLDRTDGILPGRYDLVGVVLHGIGHILGFQGSALEVAAMLADPLLPRAVSPAPLDLFKLEKGTGKTDFTGAARILDLSVEKVLYDGGFYDPSALGLVGLELGDVPVTDADGGFDHWDARFSDFGVQVPMSVGAIDPLEGRELNITEQDRQAMDLIGYNVVGGAIPSDWRGVILETASHDRNVAAVTEQESLGVAGVVVTGPTIENNTPATAQHLGSLASREFAGDENLRLGFEVYGQTHSPTDVDVYSFNAFPGTEVWFDVDRSSVAFDSVIELISSDGEVLARSNNSMTEMQSFPEFVKAGVFAAGLQRSVYGSVDYFSQNIFDAGMRVVLPGSATGQLTYHVRVRSAGSTENGPGVTSGAYNLQIRIRELDEHAGSTVQFADIGYATDAIRLRGLPSHTPLSGEVAEDTTLNSQLAGESENNRVCIRQTTSILVGVCTPRIYDRAFADAQYVGNLLTTDRGTISIAGRLSDSDRFFPESPFDSFREGLEGPGDVDWYLFEVNYDQTATNGRESTNGGLGIPRSVDVTFDVDYADGFASVDSSLQVYRASFSDGIGNLSDVGRGSLVFDSRQAYDPDDQPRPGFGVDLTDLSRGSGGKLDPFLGPVRLETGFYLLRVATAQTEPLEMSQFTDILPANPFIRMSPAPAATRLVDDPVSSIPNSDTFLGTPSLVPYSLGDLVLFGSRKTGSPSEPGTEIVTIDPFLGVTETVVGSFPFSVGDISLRDNPQFDRASNDRPQRIHAFRTMAPDGGPQPIDESVGNYFNISPENGRLLVPEDPGGDPHDDQILTYVEDPNFEPNPDDPEPPPAVRAQEVEEGKGGIQFDALVFNASAADRQTGLAVGWRSDLLDTNIMYRFDSETGKALGGVRAEDDLLPTRGLHAGTDIIELGILRTTSGGRANSMMAVPRGPDIVDGTKVVIAKAGGTPATVEFEFDSGMVYRFRTDPNSGQHVRDGDTFQVSGLQYEFDTGPVLVLNSAGSVADGQTLTLTDARGVTRIFEFDQGNGVTSGNMAIPISGNIADAIVSAVNGVGNFSVRTSLVGANRISLISDSQSVLPLSTSSGVMIEGALGGTGNVIRVEESFTTSELVSAIVSALPAASVGVSGERVNFLGASNLRNLISRGVVVIFDEAVGTGAGVQAVPYLISDTAAVVASRLVTATKTFETSMNLPNFFAATAQGDAVTLGAGATFSGTVPGFIVGGNAPGGLISGMAFVSQKVGANDVHRLFAVSDGGGLYEVLGFNDSPALRYITGSFRTSGRAGFTGLTVVPQGHALAGTLIASTSNALFAFDINGVPQPIFQNGATSIGLSVSDLVGIDFAIQPKNLWHVDDRRGNDIGHSLENATSLYFGDTGGAENSRNYDFAGGAHGTIISPQFSLAGYSENDDPYLYFTYLLSTEEAYRKPGTARDAFRVFVSDNATEAGQGQWHLLATNQLPSDYRPGALGLDATEYNSLGDPRVPQVEPLFDSTYQDVPFLIPRTETTPVGAAPNRQRDPFPFLDEDGKRPYEAEVFPDLLNETDNVWRQARISLKEFIGSSDLRLRFEFSTAASLDFGVTNTGGVELHAVAGTRLRDGDTFQIGTGASATTFEFDFGQSVTTVSGALLADGQVMVVDGPTGTPITLEFDTDGNVSAGSTRVTLTPDITASGLARSIADILRATAPTINVTQIDNKLSFPTAYVSTDAPFVVSGQIGVATGRERIAVTTEMTAANVAEQVQQSLARVFSKGVASAFPRHDSIVKVIGRTVSDAGPLGLADQLPGDDFGSFNSPLRGADNNGLQFGLPDDEARFTVQYEGVYLDDIIIGFASRGEATVDLRPELCDLIACTEINLANPEQELTGPVDVFALAGLPTSRAVVPQPSTISDGLYQVEIRRGSNDVIPDGNIDPRDRRANGVTLFAPSGADLFDGQLFTLGDGKNVVVFEFDDLTRANGVTNGNEKISFRPEFSDSVMAELIRDAVQNVTERRLLHGIIAATSDGRTSGIDGTTNRVNLFGNAFVGRDTAPNGIPFAVVDAFGSGNLSRDQGQVVIASNNIRNSANYGIVSEAPPRGLPGENGLSGLPITPNQDHSQFSHSDYASPYGSPRQLVKDNVERLSTGVVIANNVVAYGGRGGIHLSGDEGGYSIVAPVAGDPPSPLAINEVWDELSFIFDVTDHNGLTQRFEFNRDGARTLPAGTISVTWFMTGCVHPAAACSNRTDTADALMRAIQSSNLDVTVYRSSLDELYVTGATRIVSNLGNWFDIFARPVQSAAVPFARVLNNTIVGNGGVLENNTEYNAEDFNDIGIFVEHSISPTLMNNVVANFKRGVVSDNTSQTTVVTGSTFQGNVRNAVNINATDFTVVLPVDARPFTDFANGVFYPAAASSLIDSSIDSLEERRDLGLFKENVGIGLSPILAPSHDLLGQLRVDDPLVEPPSGVGDNVFKDRGALDRADITGPRASLLTPLDNDGITDKNSAFTQVRLDTTLLSRFEIRLNDLSDLADVNRGSGVNNSTVTSGAVTIRRDGVTLVDGVDYSFSYDSTNRTIRLTPLAGVWEAGHTYVITLANSGDEAIKDIAGHSLLANQDSGATTFTVEFEVPTDYGDAPDPSYPTLLSRDGARHTIVPTVFLGVSVDADVDGQPTSAADGDVDDGVTFSEILPGASATFTITASVGGFLEGWIDYNRDGDWADSGEQV